MPSASGSTTGATQSPPWWTRGVNLHERLPLAAPPYQPPDATAWAEVRRWRSLYGAPTGSAFTRRLAEDGLDEAGLAGLFAEPDEVLAARVPTPGWARYVEGALTGQARAQSDAASVGASGPVDDWQAALCSAMHPLLDPVRAALDRPNTAFVDHAGLSRAFLDRLGRRLVHLAIRTLVLELNRAGMQGRLAGPSPAARFADFTRQLAGGELVALLRRYPVLARVLGQTCRHAVAAHQELLVRFNADRADIVRVLLAGADPGALVGLQAEGDPHRRGRTVATLLFANGERVLYKPRPVELHVHFNEMVEWLNRRIAGLGLRTVTVLPRRAYGWAEFIPHRPCRDPAELQRFYHRQGALLALLYVLDGTDMHYENLVACADQPVLVDVETLFHPRLQPKTTVGRDPAVAALAASVYRTAMLPLMVQGEFGAADVSGLGGDKGNLLPAGVVGWADPGTDTMRLVRHPGQMPAGHNRPRLADCEAEPAEYRSALLAGFRAAYDAIAAHRADLVGPNGLLRRCAADEARFIPRPTYVYASLLDESTHPDVMGHALQRDHLFDLLWVESLDDPSRRRLVRHELADLWAGDIPLFTIRPGERDGWAADGTRLPELLEVTGLDLAEAKVAAMGAVDRHNQEWLITAALAMRPQPESHRGTAALGGPVTAVVPDPQRILAAACGVADRLVASALTDAGRVNWIGMELVDDRCWTVLPMGAGLPHGYCGLALFLAQLADLTGASRYTELAVGAVRPVSRLIEALVADPEAARIVGCGFNGLGGICFALSRLTVLLGRDGQLLACLRAAVELAAAMADTAHATAGATATDAPGGPEPATFADGEAGGLAAMLAVHAETGLPQAGLLATRYADRLAELVETEQPRLGSERGLARGPAGAGWALLRYAAAVPAERHRAAGRAALALDGGRPGPAGGNGRPDHGWCAGTWGAAVAQAVFGTGPADTERWIADQMGRPLLHDFSLCHGELGVTEALVTMADHGHEEAGLAVHRRAGLVLGAIEQRGPLCGTPGAVPTPGLLSGLAGIGYGLLRLGFAKQVPSVLLLEPAAQPQVRRVT